jgi:hypothetical protein
MGFVSLKLIKRSSNSQLTYVLASGSIINKINKVSSNLLLNVDKFST